MLPRTRKTSPTGDSRRGGLPKSEGPADGLRNARVQLSRLTERWSLSVGNRVPPESFGNTSRAEVLKSTVLLGIIQPHCCDVGVGKLGFFMHEVAVCIPAPGKGSRCL